MIRHVSIIAALLLTGCSTVIAEQEGTITLNGATYRTVTRTFENNDGRVYSRRTIYAGAERVTCKANDILDCRTAMLGVDDRKGTGP